MAISSNRSNTGFLHETLDVYQASLQFCTWVHSNKRKFPSGTTNIAQQLTRASQSIPLNLAEGRGQQSLKMAKKHYRIALGSAAECSACIDLLEVFGARQVGEARGLIGRIGAMCAGLAR